MTYSKRWTCASAALTLALCGAGSDSQIGGASSTATIAGAARGAVAEDPGGHVDLRVTRARTRSPAGAAAAPSSAATPTALAPNFFFQGGKLLQSPEVIAVFWGSTIPGRTQGQINALYATLAGPQSQYFAALAEYDTANPPQTIGFPSYLGAVVDAAVPTSGIVTDLQVQAELSRLVDTGALPAPDGHNVYAVHFPPEVVVNGTLPDDPNPLYSCSDYLGYHSFFPRNGVIAYYTIVAECPVTNVGGRTPSTTLDQIFYTASHELVEVTTDPEGTGWVDFNLGEVGDACEFFPGVNFDGFPIQPYYSMQDRGCRVAPSNANMTISVSPDRAFLAPGASATFTITASGAVQKQPATLGLLFPPLHGTATFDQPTILAGQTAHVTFTNSSLFATRIQDPWVYAFDDNDDFHYGIPILVMDGLAPTITSVTPGHGGSQGVPGVVIQGSNFRASTQVLFGDQPGAVQGVFSGGTQLHVFTPSQPPGTVDVSVTSVTGQTNTLAGGYTVDPGVPPTVLSLVPGSGPAAGGYVIRMVGRNFSFANFGPTGNLNMTIGGTPAFNATFTSATAAVLVPGGPLGPQDVVVANPDGLSTTVPGGFRYASGFNGGGPPVPLSLSVSSGPPGGGTYVTVYGLNFDNGARVYVGGVAALPRSTSSYFVGVVTAPHAPGPVDVEIVNSDGSANTLPAAFTYQ
jgi:hypothetical protein